MREPVWHSPWNGHMDKFPMMGDLYTVRVPEDVADTIATMAEEQNKSMGEMLAQLIWDGLPTDATIRMGRGRKIEAAS